jgi:BirA family biotin operon repressor/biotin-[acetyl-CoA-carboxylase] ligase
LSELPLTVPPLPPLQWGAESLWEQLEPLLPGISVEVVARLSSTNSALLERARVNMSDTVEAETVQVRRSVESAAFGRRSVDLQPCLLVAEQQTGGRGRLGRTWQSVPGASLTFSLALPLAPADWSGLSLAVGVALADALEPAAAEGAPLRIGLKWPNDLWLMDDAAQGPRTGRKLGGVLIETVTASPQRLAVIGVGINVLPFPAPAANTGIACLQEMDPGVNLPGTLAKLAVPLVKALKTFERDGFAAFADRFAARDLLRDRPVQLSHAEVREGICRGVAPSGALLVEAGTGLLHVTSGEVSVRLQPVPAPQPTAVAPAQAPGHSGSEATC